MVTITDDDGHTATQTINLTVNAVADIVNDTQSVAEDTVDGVTTNLLTNDSFENSSRSITAVTQGASGTVSIVNAATGTVKYTPNANFNGTDSYTYTVTSPAGITETATVTVTVTAVDDASVLAADTNTISEDNPATGNVLTNDSDIDSSLTVASFTVGADGDLHHQHRIELDAGHHGDAG